MINLRSLFLGLESFDILGVFRNSMEIPSKDRDDPPYVSLVVQNHVMKLTLSRKRKIIFS